MCTPTLDAPATTNLVKSTSEFCLAAKLAIVSIARTAAYVQKDIIILCIGTCQYHSSDMNIHRACVWMVIMAKYQTHLDKPLYNLGCSLFRG